MTSSATSISSFLKDAFVAYAPYSTAQKQDMQKAALKWLQLHISNELEDKTILEQFAQKWRKDSTQSLSAAPLYLETLPGSYKGKKSVSGHQEEALNFLQATVPLQMQEDFKERWNLKSKLQVSNSAGATFKVDQREITLLQQDNTEGDGTAWCHVEDQSVYYLLSYEEQGDDYRVELGEEIGSQNQNTWFVSKEHVKISNI
ncbi:MAG: hypothetical protein AAFX01_10095 [Cyanobacteria bacterium J06638_28]